MRRVVLPCLLAVTGVLASAAPAAAAEFVPGELIVRFKPGVSGSERADARRDQGATLDRALPVPGAQLLELPAGQGVRRAAASFEDDPRVDWAEPNWIYRASAIPDDPFFSNLWGLHNTGQASGLVDADIDAPEAWDQPTGAPATVAVVDTGVAFEHPDLAGKLVAGWDFVDDDSAPADLDLSGSHGTHVAGTIAAAHGNAEGVAGVSRTAQIMPLRALDYTGSGTSAWVASAFDHAGAAGVPIVNASLGGRQSNLIREAIGRWPSTLFVVAAGNCGLNNDTAIPSGAEECGYGAEYPCSLPAPNVLCVAASDRNDHRASFSNWGPGRVDLAAPGVATQSTSASFDDDPATEVVDPAFRELFEDGVTGWRSTPHVGASSWTTSAGGHSPSDRSQPELGLALSPSGPYEASADTSVAKADPIALTGRDGCQVLFDLRMDVTNGDTFRIEASTDTLVWTPILARSQSTPDADNDRVPDWSTVGADLANGTAGYDFNGAPVYLRFRFTSGATPGKGVFIDFVEIYCTRHNYGLLSGTSMATPHVAGAAAEVLAADRSISSGADPAGVLKARLLNSVDPSPCWAGLTVTGGRLNLARALGVHVGGSAAPAGCTEAGQGESNIEPPPDPQARPASPPLGTDTGITPTPTPVDIDPPVVSASAARHYRAASLLRRGLRARIRCDEECRIRSDVLVGRRTAKRYGIKGRRYGRSYVLVGRARTGLSRAGSKTVVTKISRRAHRGLRRARRVRLVLRVVARDDRGNDRVTRRSVTVRR